MTSKTIALEAINKIIQDMNLASNYRACLDSVVAKICRLFHVKRCSLMVLGKTKRLTIHASRGIEPRIAKQVDIKLGEGISGKVAKTGRPVLVRDIEKHQVFKKKQENRYFTKSFLSAPLKIDNRVVGVINLNNKTDHSSFNGEDLKLLKPLISHIAVIVKNALLINELDASNLALKKRMSMLNTLFQLSQEVIRAADIKNLFQEIIANSVKLLDGDSGSLMLYNETNRHLEIKASVGLDRNKIQYAALQNKRKSLAHWVAQHGRPLLLIGSLKQHPRFADLDCFDHFKSILSVPLTIRAQQSTEAPSSLSVPLSRNKKTIGVININRMGKQVPFSQKDLQFLTVLSFQIAMAVENAELLMREKRYLHELKETQAKLENAMADINEELKMARHIQHNMLPRKLPDLEGIRVAAKYIPSGAIGGDLYDIIPISGDKIAFLIFDVAGHGLAAALVTAMAKISFIKNIRQDDGPKAILERVNEELHVQLDEESYLTAFLCILDRHSKILTYCKAGHPPALLIRSGAPTPEKLLAQGSFVGIFPDEVYEEKTVQLSVGDKVLLYTDGLIECHNPDLAHFDPDILSRKMADLVHASPEEIIIALTAQVTSTTETRPDDITLMAFELLDNLSN
ncbi:MAG: hypothetical protein A2293_12495 [Elusimicrobia bacterium RIFOXYB2_FULL_49_7]|nr:MAG: hypothetical protein A2293_12495 [Elusimicrobia bacterium RIFOXYB2_FULL_49_7]